MYSYPHTLARISLWAQIQSDAVRYYEEIIAADPDTYGIAPTASQIREDRRRRNGTRRPPRGSKRQRKVQ